jgi:hypothetical protein
VNSLDGEIVALKRDVTNRTAGAMATHLKAANLMTALDPLEQTEIREVEKVGLSAVNSFPTLPQRWGILTI